MVNLLLHPASPYLALTISCWITYCYVIFRGGFVSDDLMGIAEYDGKLQGFEYGMISRWVRYHLCGGNFPSKHKFPNGQPVPTGKIPARHHTLSVVVFTLSVLSTYYFLQAIVGPKVAFLACLLFAVHPVVTQGVAWISGLGYPLSLLWITLSLNLLGYYYSFTAPSTTITCAVFLGFLLIQFLAINALFVALVSFPILLFMGYYPFAILAILISIVQGAQIVRATIKLRKDEFEKQAMGGSTFIKPRKFIVAAKTFLYYIIHSLFPSRMGLYHKWGYHYGSDVERESIFFFLGLLAAGGVVTWFFLTPIIAIKLGLLWFSCFIFIFLNWITIQQFVTERYLMIPVIGICLIVSYFLQDYIYIYTFILGLALCRTWLHLPTYDDELRFYLSNTWNFKNSEVAYGNLGVTRIRIGQVGAALDCWHEAIHHNPDYDVPYYNIYSHYKSNALFQVQRGNFQGATDLLKQAHPYLVKCVACKVCHFKEQWTKELVEVTSWINTPILLVVNEKTRITQLRDSLQKRLSELKDPKNPVEIQDITSSITDASKQLESIERMLESQGVKPVENPKP